DVALEVAVLGERAAAHGAERSHAAVFFESLALENDDLARALVGAGEEAAEHDGAGAGRDRLGDVTGVLDAAIGDDRDAVLLGGPGGVVDRRDLWDAGAGDDACGADGAGADADLEPVRAGRDQILGGVGGRDIP